MLFEIFGFCWKTVRTDVAWHETIKYSAIYKNKWTITNNSWVVAVRVASVLRFILCFVWTCSSNISKYQMKWRIQMARGPWTILHNNNILNFFFNTRHRILSVITVYSIAVIHNNYFPGMILLGLKFFPFMFSYSDFFVGLHLSFNKQC